MLLLPLLPSAGIVFRLAVISASVGVPAPHVRLPKLDGTGLPDPITNDGLNTSPALPRLITANADCSVLGGGTRVCATVIALAGLMGTKVRPGRVLGIVTPLNRS